MAASLLSIAATPLPRSVVAPSRLTASRSCRSNNGWLMNTEAGQPSEVRPGERIDSSTSWSAVRKSMPGLGRMPASISSAQPSSCMMRMISWSTWAALGNG